MKIIGLDSSEFWEKYLPLCKPLTGLTDAETEKFSAALDSLTSKLEKALSSYNEGEYEIAYDWNTCWHHCGGVFGKKAFCPDFIQCIADKVVYLVLFQYLCLGFVLFYDHQIFCVFFDEVAQYSADTAIPADHIMIFQRFNFFVQPLSPE